MKDNRKQITESRKQITDSKGQIIDIVLDVDGQTEEVSRLVEVGGDDTVSLDISVNHKNPDTKSKIQILIIAKDQAKVNINGLVRVDTNAKGSSAEFKVKTLIVSGHPTIKVEPCMEVLNSNSMASHSVSTINLTKEALFYASSRGLDEGETKKLLIKSIVNSAKIN